jgi:hypothetical protein
MATSPIPDKATEVRPRRIWRCAFEGCPATSEQPALDGWVGFASDLPGLNGRYCPEHGRALEAVLEAGDDLDDDDDDNDNDV